MSRPPYAEDEKHQPKNCLKLINNAGYMTELIGKLKITGGYGNAKISIFLEGNCNGAGGGGIVKSDK